MLKLAFDATVRDDQRHFHVLYYSVANGGAREARHHDVRERERALMEKLRSISVVDPKIDRDAVPWDAPEPRVLTTGVLLLTPAERDMADAYVTAAGWPAHMSAIWLALRARLAEAEKVAETS